MSFQSNVDNLEIRNADKVTFVGPSSNTVIETTTGRLGIGTNTPSDALHVNGGVRFAGHIIPDGNSLYDIGEPENKIRDMYVDTNSLWIGDLTKIAFERGKMKFKRRKTNKVPTALFTLATSHVSELNTEADVQTDAVSFAQAIDPTISAVDDLKLEHWRDYAKTFDETKAVSDIFIDNDEDYEAVTASEAFMEVGSNIFTTHALSIGKETDPTSTLDVLGTVKATALHVADTMQIANSAINTETVDIVKIAAVNTTTTTSAPHTSWSQEQKILAYSPSSYDYFGQQSAVSGDGNTICVSARNEDTTANDSGAVYVYTYGSGTWTYRARLKASDAQASDVLGEAGLAISDDGRTIVVAARLEDTGGTSAGAAYVFMSSNSTWTSFTQQKLQASNKAANDQFCRCDVSGDGNTIIVGAPHEDGPTNSVASSGAAYIYSRSGNSWSEDQILYPTDPVLNNYFGTDNALNVDGTVAAIAATGDDTSATDSGAVYIFTKSNGTWSQETKLKITNGGPNASDSWGGVSLSDDGLTLSAGTSNDDTTASNSGAVYVFNKSDGTWSQTVKLKASNAGANDKLGGRTRISGTGHTIVSGAREEDTGTTNAGSAYIFALNNGTWTQRQQIQASDRGSGDLFGDSVSISKDGTVISVGAVLEDGGGGDSGSAYIFRGTGGGTITTTTTIPSSLKVNDTIVATAFEGDGSALTGITSGQWTESGGDIYRSSGNVGVGITSPDYKLHAYTNTTGSNIMELEHDGTTTSGGPSGTNHWMQFRYGGRVGMTIKAPDNSVNTPVTFATGNAFKFMVDSTEPLTIDYLGNVGINKTTPDRDFHVVGTSRFDGEVEWYKAGQRTSHANYSTNRDWYIRSGSTAGKVVIQDGGGKVGVGTSNPYVPLHVVGYSGSLSAAYCIYAKGNDAAYSRQFHLQSSMGWNNLSVYASDDIVTGQYLVSHLGTLSSSDERIKENIVDVDDASALELFRLLKPKKYEYIDKIKRGNDTVFGFIAQDVEKTLPHGTRKVEETIPNIMEIGAVTETNIITFSNFNTSNLQSNIHTLELTDKNANPVLVTVKEIIDEHSVRVDKDLSELLYEFDENGNDITEIVTITEPEYNTLEDTSGYVYDEINKVYTKILSNKIYVYGERIDNFLKVNKDTIWTVSTAALQEVDRQQQADKVRITELETQLASVLARLEALESA